MKVERHVVDAIFLVDLDDASPTILGRADNGAFLDVIHDEDETLLQRPQRVSGRQAATASAGMADATSRA